MHNYIIVKVSGRCGFLKVLVRMQNVTESKIVVKVYLVQQQAASSKQQAASSKNSKLKHGSKLAYVSLPMWRE